MRKPLKKKQDFYLSMVNNTPIRQKVVLFDLPGAYNSSNAIVENENYGWDITNELANAIIHNLDILVFVATNKTGLYQQYIFVNPSGTFISIDQVIVGLNSFEIGTFFKIGLNKIVSYNFSFQLSSISLTHPYSSFHSGITNATDIGSFIYNPGYTPSLGGTSVQINPGNPFWINATSSLTAGPFNRNSVGIPSASIPLSPSTGFFTQIQSNESTVVYFGFSSITQLYLNNQQIINAVTNLNKWYIIPVTLNKGNNLIQLFANPSGGFYINPLAFEIYDNTAAEISSATDYSTLNMLFRSIDYLGQDLF